MPGRRTVTLQNDLNGYTGCADTRISAEAPNANFGVDDLRVGAKQKISSLVYFDLSSIPSSATVESAQLSVYAQSREGPAGFNVRVHAVKRRWNQHEATWNVATLSDPWGIPGCNCTVTDRDVSVEQDFDTWQLGWYALPVRDSVQRMVQDPTTNKGWLIRQSAEIPGVLCLRSSEYSSVELRPKLEITYVVP